MGGERGTDVIGLLCPGQGSQFVGMGRDLAQEFPVAKRTFQEADDAISFRLSRLCWEGPPEDLTLTMNCQPAILVHTIAVWRILQAEAPIDVSLGAGHSLGEFSAYVASGAIRFDEGVRTVRTRGELMSQSDGKRPGGMTVLLGLDDAAAETLCQRASAESSATVVPANYNSPGQLVISGDVQALRCAEELSKEMGFKRAIRLNVSGAFHSPLMNVAVPGLSEALDSVHFETLSFPVISNVTAQPVNNGDTARNLLVEQLISPVRWVDSVLTMRTSGIEKFVEIGPGNVLSGLSRRIDRAAPARALGTAAEVTAYLREEA